MPKRTKTCQWVLNQCDRKKHCMKSFVVQFFSGMPIQVALRKRKFMSIVLRGLRGKNKHNIAIEHKAQRKKVICKHSGLRSSLRK